MSPTLAPFSRRLTCGAAQHTLEWADGRLTTPDHPDPERERALIALGGEPARCLSLLATWEEHRTDLDVLVAASRGPADRIVVVAADGDPAHAGAQGSFGWVAYAPMSHVHRPRGPRRRYRGRPHFGGGHEPNNDLADVLGLGDAFAHRLVATVLTEWCARIEREDPSVPDALPALRAALYGRVVAVVRTWLGNVRRVEVDLVGSADEPTIVTEDETIRLALPFSWLRDVWAEGLAVVCGRLCLAVDSATADEWRLRTVGPDLADLRSMRVRLDG